MDLTYPAETEPFRKEVRAWLEDNLPAGWFDDGFELSDADRARFNDEWPAKLYGGGWICATWPKEYGGKGLSTMEGVVLAEEFARAKAPMRADFFGDTLVGPTILQWGTEEQKQEFLPKILRGEMRWCQGFSEPNSGSDLASLKTTAVLDGDEWVINGQKVWTTGGPPRRLLLPADPHRSGRPEAQGHLLPARADAPGRRRGARHHPARRHGRVLRGVLHRRPLPEGQRRRRRQQRVEGGQLDARRSSAASRRRPATGASRRSTARWSPWPGRTGRSTTRTIRQRLMEYYTKIQILRINGLRSLSATVSGAKDMGVIALGATNKMFWSEMHQAAMELALDIFGAPSMLVDAGPDTGSWPGALRDKRREGYPVSPMMSSFFFSRSETIWGGTSQIQRNIVGERVLGLPKEPTTGLIRASSSPKHTSPTVGAT